MTKLAVIETKGNNRRELVHQKVLLFFHHSFIFKYYSFVDFNYLKEISNISFDTAILKA